MYNLIVSICVGLDKNNSRNTDSSKQLNNLEIKSQQTIIDPNTITSEITSSQVLNRNSSKYINSCGIS